MMRDKIRDALGEASEPQTVASLAADLSASVTSVRRHLVALFRSGQVAMIAHDEQLIRYELTPRGRRAYRESKEL